MQNASIDDDKRSRNQGDIPIGTLVRPPCVADWRDDEMVSNPLVIQQMRQSLPVNFLQHDDAGLWRFTQWAFEHVHFEISQSHEETGFNLWAVEIDVPGNK